MGKGGGPHASLGRVALVGPQWGVAGLGPVLPIVNVGIGFADVLIAIVATRFYVLGKNRDGAAYVMAFRAVVGQEEDNGVFILANLLEVVHHLA